MDFAPTSAIQQELLEHLRLRYPHVSYERLVSGNGLNNIYQFLATRFPKKVSPELRAAMRDGEAAATITEFALWRDDALAKQSVEIFVQIYGAVAGNLALTVLPRGGIFIAGGIAPKIIDSLDSSTFRMAFQQKGRMEDLLQTIPVKVITHPRAGLIGAAAVAAQLAEGR